MNEELKIICNNLKQFSELLKEKNSIERTIKQTKEEYVHKNNKLKKPQRKLIKKVERPKKPEELKIKKKLILTLSWIIGYIFLFGVVIIGAISGLNTVFLTIVGMGGFLSIVALSTVRIRRKEDEYKKSIDEYEKQCQQFNKTIEVNKRNEEYNRNYPERLEQYLEAVKKLELEYDEVILTAKGELSKIEAELKAFEGMLSPKFYQNIEEIIEIIEDGRAESVKEALNIFVSDTKQNQLIREQKEANRIADEKLEDARRHNLAMENEARRQSEYALKQANAIREQEEDRRRGAPNCWQCKNWPCGGDPAYCGSFAKKD